MQKLIQGLVWSGASFLLSATPALAQNTGAAPSLNLGEGFRAALQWVDSLGLVGGIAFIGIYVLATVAFVPGTILTLGAGVVFGVLSGSLYVFVGATLGAIAAFLVGRYLARERITRRIASNEQFQAIDAAVAREGFKIVLLTRLSPIFPFVLLNYAFGLTGVSLKDYALGSIGMIPGTLLYVYIGSLAGNLARIGTEPPSVDATVQWAFRILGFAATIGVTLYVTRIARKALAESVSS